MAKSTTEWQKKSASWAPCDLLYRLCTATLDWPWMWHAWLLFRVSTKGSFCGFQFDPMMMITIIPLFQIVRSNRGMFRLSQTYSGFWICDANTKQGVSFELLLLSAVSTTVSSRLEVNLGEHRILRGCQQVTSTLTLVTVTGLSDSV